MPHDHGKEGELVKEKNAVDSKVTTLHDAIHIFNKFDVLDSYEHIEVRSAFGYEDETIEDNFSKSDGEVQSTWKGRRRKQVPPITVLTRSSAKHGTTHNKLKMTWVVWNMRGIHQQDSLNHLKDML